jgi:TonB-linked SusC/RagA family outer membrane protein
MKKILNYPDSWESGLNWHKLLLTMKLTIFLLFVSLINLVAAPGYSQNTKITFKANQTSVKEILEKIENSSEFYFLFNQNLIDVNRKVDIKAKDKPIKDILEEIFGDEVNYMVYDRQIILTPASSSENLAVAVPQKSNEGIVHRNGNMIVSNQQVEISGKITDENFNVIPGVNVLLKGTLLGVISDMNGMYSIKVPNLNGTLVFSFIGYKSLELGINGKTNIDVILKEDVEELKEVVVVGYGTKIKSTVTGSISSVKANDIETFSASTNVVDALQANVAGAFVVANSGRPGDVSNIYLRGPVSVNGGNPLYVVDGVPQNSVGYNFNLEDVESISVLKDASAAAIYGAKAAGGVILITTKHGSKSKMKITLNSSVGVRNVYTIPDLLNRDEYIKAKKLAGYDVVDLYGPEAGWKDLPDTDWMDEAYRLGIEQNYGVSLSGGGDVSKFYISGNYNKVEGTAIGNWINRYTLRINTDHTILKKLTFNQGMYFTNSNEDPPVGSGLVFRRTPVMAVYDPAAITNRGYAQVVRGFQGNNAIQGMMDNYQREEDWTLNLTGNLTYNIFKGLNASVFAGTTMYFGDDYNYVYEVNNGAVVNPATITKAQNRGQDYIVTYTLNYDRTFKDHHINALAGYEARKSETANVIYNNLSTLIPEAQSSSLVSSILSASGSFAQGNVLDRILSQFGRLEYSFKEKYLVTANIRRDGYGSKFGPNYKYGVFPGVSTGWVVSKEKFLKKYSFIDLLKLRAGYGLLGNAVGTDFAYTAFYEVGYAQDWSATDTNTKQTSVALATQLANPEIRWESVATTNIGLDGTLWKNHLSFNLDYYSRQTKEMLYNVPVSLSAGVGTSVQANVGQMSNKGLESFIEYRGSVGNFNFNLGFNSGFNKNKLISLNPDIEKLYIASGNITGGESGNGMYGNISPNRSEPGQPLGLFYGYQTNGIYATDIAAGETRPTVKNYVPVAGDLIFVDQNTDGVIDTKDQVYIGNPWPKFTYGFTMGANWRNLIDIRAIFNGVYGNDIYNAYESYTHNFYSDYSTTSEIYESSFFGDNGLTNVPRNITVQKPDRNGNWGSISDYHIQKGSYLMLKNLQIGFTLPKSVISRLHVSKAKAFITGENLITITKYKGLTPLIPPYNRSILAQGVDNPSTRYPSSRYYSVGLSVEF